MRIKSDFALRQVAGTWVVLPFGSEIVNFNGMLKLNESSALLWKELERGADRQSLVSALTSEYDVDVATAAADVDAFLKKLEQIGCLTE